MAWRGASLEGGLAWDPTPCPRVARFPHSLLTDLSSVTTELRPRGWLTEELPGGECDSGGGPRASITPDSRPSLCRTTVPYGSLRSSGSSAHRRPSSQRPAGQRRSLPEKPAWG